MSSSKPSLNPSCSSPKPTSSPSKPRTSNSRTPSRRPVSADGEKLVKTRWSGYKKVIASSNNSKQGQTQTHIPSLHRGKEILRGGGSARVIKPITRPKQVTAIVDPNYTISTNTIKPSSRSPRYISSKAVPDLHNKILAKIRLSKRKSRPRNFTSPHKSLSAPCSMTEASTRPILSTEDECYESDRDSPVSDQDLDTYLASMFYKVDTYRTGLVTAGSLLEYLGGLVDLPKLDKWKLEELSRMLDPDMDNRYVDQALWSKVGQAWVEMMMDPGNHLDGSTGLGDVVKDEQDIPEEDISTDASYGSVEGVGGAQGCSSKEVDLENTVSELRYQLARLGNEKIELERNLTGTEELAQKLTTELKESHEVMLNLSPSFHRGEMVFKEAEQMREVQEQCCTLRQEVEELSRELEVKDSKLRDMGLIMVTINREMEELRENEDLVKSKLEEKIKKCVSMEVEVKVRGEQLLRERTVREEMEGKLECTQLKLKRFEMELSVKEDEIRNLTETGRDRSVEGNKNNSASIVHDVSVDDCMIEESLKPQQCASPLSLTPSRMTFQSPVLRGPSASSTPHKGRKESIADEFKDMEACSVFPSPLCEKKAKGVVRVEVMKLMDVLGESMRRIILNQIKPGISRQAMVCLNREMANVKRKLEEKLAILSSSDEIVELQIKAIDLEAKLSEAESVIDILKSGKADMQAKADVPEVVLQVENKVEALASLLQSANSVLLATTEGTETPPDCSLDQGTNLSNWQLDLEGIQLVDWNSQLGRRLAHYSRCGKRNSLAELSCRSLAPIGEVKSPLLESGHQVMSSAEQAKSPAPSDMPWQSLYRRLEDLQLVSEVSKDLLLMAGDSLREQSFNQDQSNLVFLKTVSCQTSLPPRQDEPQTATKSAQTDLLTTSHDFAFSTCPVENCFCSSSQNRHNTSWWSKLWRSAGSLVLVLVAFTFLCGIEIDQALYYPVTWYPLRDVMGDWLPTPRVLLSYQTVPTHIW
eukprot:GFUD01001272.1.p1 GENE.GFUD01001272.1~~GFUD01001272.1.p1  ORF type:complete len:986 (+),score=248.57 GFUD01001272.1:48-3005(+)